MDKHAEASFLPPAQTLSPSFRRLLEVFSFGHLSLLASLLSKNCANGTNHFFPPRITRIFATFAFLIRIRSCNARIRDSSCGAKRA
jgi:hypothetical protein